MLIKVIDFETTGEPPEASVCEIGWSDVRWHAGPAIETDPPTKPFAVIGEPFSRLVAPSHPMTLEARAVHHITDAELEGAPEAADVMPVDDVDAYCAHRADFERAFFTGGGKPWICTYKAALRLWPTSPRHSNQVLRYFLGLDQMAGFVPALAMPPHRAGPDAYVTAWILSKALQLASVEQLIEWSSKPGLLPNVTFGKHRGQTWASIPADYLVWLIHKSDMGEDVKFTAQHHLDLRQQERQQSRY